MKHKRFVFGIGTGRCGTLSLAQFLNNQPDATVTHEMRPLLRWDVTDDEKQRIAMARCERMARQSAASLVGDIASFYLPYVPFLLQANPDTRVVCLRRPRYEVIGSFIEWLKRTEPLPVNHWLENPWRRGEHQREFHSPVWSRIFPKYPDVTLEEGIGRYWDEYYAEAEQFQDRYPGRILMLETHELNLEYRQRELLSFCGIDESLQRIGAPHANIGSTAPQCRRNTTYASPDSPANCVVLVLYGDSISESCEGGLRQLENQGYEVRRIRIGADETIARNHATLEALRDGFLETLWIDSSVRFHPDSVRILRAHQADLACIPVFGRFGPQRAYVPSSPSADVRFGQLGDLISVDAAALHFLHVRRYVYEEIATKRNLPLIEERTGAFIPFFVPTYQPVDDGHRFSNAAETFCGLVRQCGFSILADCRIRIWSTEPYAYSWEDSGRAPARCANLTVRLQ